MATKNGNYIYLNASDFEGGDDCNEAIFKKDLAVIVCIAGKKYLLVYNSNLEITQAAYDFIKAEMV